MTSASLRTSTSSFIGSHVRGRSARSSVAHASPCRTTQPGGSSAPFPTRERSKTGPSRRISRTWISSPGWVLRQNGRAIPLEPVELVDSVVAALPPSPERTTETLPTSPGRSGPIHVGPSGAARRPGRPGALRSPAGAARTPSRLVRRRALCNPRCRRGRGTLLHPARGAAGSPLAAQPRQLRRRLLRGLRRARRRCRSCREGALRRRLPPATQAHAARGTRDPPRDGVRRPDHRGRRAHAAEASAQEARGDVRPIRPRRHARPAGRLRRGVARPSAVRRRREAASSSRSST